jgi:hypothetical protein
MKKIITLITLIISTLTFAQEETAWEYIGVTDNNSEIYVKIEKSSTYEHEAWVKMTIPVTSKKSKSGKFIKSGGGYKLAYWDIQCENKTFSTSSRITYNSKGVVISRGEVYDDLNNERVIPDTIGDFIFKYICNYTTE